MLKSFPLNRIIKVMPGLDIQYALSKARHVLSSVGRYDAAFGVQCPSYYYERPVVKAQRDPSFLGMAAKKNSAEEKASYPVECAPVAWNLRHFFL